VCFKGGCGDRGAIVKKMAFPDFWYQTSQDIPDKSDSTQLKRVAAFSVVSPIFLANAGKSEITRMITETSNRGLPRSGLDRLRAETLLEKADEKTLVKMYKEAINIVNQAFEREQKALLSIHFFIKNVQEF
jgi:hypothetical protein